MAAYKQLLKTGIAPEDLMVGGDSAGGGLATALLLKVREDGLPMPAGLYLLSPWLDMATTAPSYDKFGARDLIVSRDEIRRNGLSRRQARQCLHFARPRRSGWPAADADSGQ